MNLSPDLGIWLAALLTLGVFSLLWRDNPLYRLCEAVFIGVSAGYILVVQYENTLAPNLIGNLMRGRAAYLIPAVFGVALFLRFIPRLSWAGRWSVAFVLGIFSGAFFIGFLKENFLNQLAAAIVPLIVVGENGFDPVASISNIVMVVGTAAVLFYFYFSKEHTGWAGKVAEVGAVFLMIGFGAGFGCTVMGRVSLLIGRLNFLFGDWLGILH